MICPIKMTCDEDVTIMGDIILIRRIVNNMLKNAVEASGEDAVSIGFLIKEIPEDVFKEELDAIKDMLFAHFAKEIRSVLTKGVPEWYKDELLKKQFEKDT